MRKAACIAVSSLVFACASVSAKGDAVEPDVQPGDDFFAYANAEWLAATEIPAGKGKWSAGSEIAERTRQQVEALLADAAAATPGSDARKVADFRAALLDDATIESRGLAPLKPLLARIDRLQSKAALTRLLGSELSADVDPMNFGVYDSQHLIGLAVQAGNHGEKEYVAYLLQGGLGLPDRALYIAADARSQTRRTEYLAAVADVLARLRPASAGTAATTARRAEAVMALETAIARSHATPEASGADHDTGNVWKRADFVRNAPGMDWNEFFAAAGLAAQQSFVAWQPAALTGAAALVADQPLPVWKDYLRLRVVARHADAMPRSLYASATTLRGVAVGTDAPGARAERALEATRSAMSDAIGRMYVERHFPLASKVRLQAIVADVVAAFTKRVEAAAWLSPSARTMALAKLKVVYFGVGYPDRWQDDAGVKIDAADAVGNLRRIAQRDYRRALSRLGRPADPTEWVIAPQWPGAVLTFQQNAYNFSAALLQPPKFDASASDAANYGAIGAIVGHELSHFVDSLGADYDADGRQRRWWTDDDMARYRTATEPLVRQFSAYRPFADVAVDGKLGLTENLADLGGLVAAFDAYRRTLGSRASDADYVRQQDREFFIGFARGWRAKYRDDALKTQAASDHAPEMYRISTVRNVDAWYDAFDVKPGQRLYLAPEARVRIW